jgi:hypothetical protein
MEYILKAQNIGGFVENNNNFAIAHEFDVLDDISKTKRGKLFIVLNIDSENLQYNLKSAVKLFLDKIQEDYYRITEDTPLHAIEKSLNKAYKNLISFSNEEGAFEKEKVKADIHVSFATALIWNSVLYTSYLGNPAVYLIRGTGIRNLNASKGTNEVWTNSSILTDEDVILIGTEGFSKEFPIEEINRNLGGLTTSIARSPNKAQISATLIKVEDKDKKSRMKAVTKLNQEVIRGMISNHIWNIRSRITGTDSLSERFKIYQNKKTAPVASINSLITNSPSYDVSGKTIPKRISKVKSTKKGKKAALIGVLMIISLGLINYKIIGHHNNQETSEVKDEFQTTRTTETLAQSGNVQGITKIAGIHPNFINLSHISENFLPVDVSSNKIDLIYFLGRGSLFEIDFKTKETREILSGLGRTKYVTCDKKDISNRDQLCYILADNTLSVISPTVKNPVDAYPVDLGEVLDISSYQDKVYFLNNESVYQITRPDETLVKWIKTDTQMAENPRRIAIDGSIYILTNREVRKYTLGVLESNFELSDTSHLLNPINIEISGNNIYILDSNENSDRFLVIYNKRTGQYINKYLLADKIDLENLNLFTLIEGANKSVLFRKGDSLYSFPVAE